MKLHFSLIVVVVFLISACAPIVKEEPKPVPKKIADDPVEVVMPLPVPEPPQQDVLILLSSSASTYQQIADNLSNSLGDHVTQITLSGQPAQDNAMVRDISASSTTQIVAVGSKAVKSIQSIKDKQVIFSQVINYHGLVKDNIKGVSALPSPEKLFKDWKALSPGLSKVAVITGKNLDIYLSRAKKAAKAQNIELIIEKVSSDKDFSYRSKKLKPDVEGQWIIPDNRVLSVKALKDVMAYGSRRGRQIVVFSPKLLSFGGFFYVSPDLDAVSEGVLKRLNDSVGKTIVLGDSVMPILNHTMGINQNIARQFNLKIPREYLKYVNGK